MGMLQWALCSISRPEFIHPLQQRRFHCTDLLIQLCQTAGLKDKVRKKMINRSKQANLHLQSAEKGNKKNYQPEQGMSLVACAGDSTERKKTTHQTFLISTISKLARALRSILSYLSVPLLTSYQGLKREQQTFAEDYERNNACIYLILSLF